MSAARQRRRPRGAANPALKLAIVTVTVASIAGCQRGTQTASQPAAEEAPTAAAPPSPRELPPPAPAAAPALASADASASPPTLQTADASETGAAKTDAAIDDNGAETGSTPGGQAASSPALSDEQQELAAEVGDTRHAAAAPAKDDAPNFP